MKHASFEESPKKSPEADAEEIIEDPAERLRQALKKSLAKMVKLKTESSEKYYTKIRRINKMKKAAIIVRKLQQGIKKNLD